MGPKCKIDPIAPKMKPSYMRPEVATEHQADIEHISKRLEAELAEHPNYAGFDLCDVGAGGIQLRLFHTQIARYVFGEQSTIKYDWSNLNEAITQAVESFKQFDNPEYIRNYLAFLLDGEKYGWD